MAIIYQLRRITPKSAPVSRPLIVVGPARRHKSKPGPSWRAQFVIPASVGSRTPGPVQGIAGASVIYGKTGRCLMGEVVGPKKDWVLRQADELADALGYYRRPLAVRLTRDVEPGLTTSAPIARGDDYVVEITRSHIIEGGAMRALAG